MAGRTEAPIAVPGEDARQGKVILDKPWRRILRVGGLPAAVIVAIPIQMAFALNGYRFTPSERAG